MTTREDLQRLTEERRTEFVKAEDNPIAKMDFKSAAERMAEKAARTKLDPEEEAEQAELRRAIAEAEERAQRHARSEAWPFQVPSRFVDAKVDDLDGDLEAVAAEWDGDVNVLLLGGVGVGKTHAALAMARTRWDDGQDLLFYPAVELLDDLRPGGPDNTMDRACAVDVLVLDDLGSEKPTDWTAERLYRIVNRRWLEERPTIATANLTADELEAAVGSRMFSRLWHGALAVEVAGEDRRRAA